MLFKLDYCALDKLWKDRKIKQLNFNLEKLILMRKFCLEKHGSRLCEAQYPKILFSVQPLFIHPCLYTCIHMCIYLSKKMVDTFVEKGVVDHKWKVSHQGTHAAKCVATYILDCSGKFPARRSRAVILPPLFCTCEKTSSRELCPGLGSLMLDQSEFNRRSLRWCEAGAPGIQDWELHLFSEEKAQQRSYCYLTCYLAELDMSQRGTMEVWEAEMGTSWNMVNSK